MLDGTDGQELEDIVAILREVEREKEEEIRRLREALEPFSRLDDEIEMLAGITEPPYDNPENWAKSCGWSDLIAARSALNQKE
jgi:hypothetical protein